MAEAVVRHIRNEIEYGWEPSWRTNGQYWGADIIAAAWASCGCGWIEAYRPPEGEKNYVPSRGLERNGIELWIKHMERLNVAS